MYTPTRKDLELLGLKHQEGLLWDCMLLAISDTHTKIMYFDDENQMMVGNKKCYPESFNDIKTLIRLFSKK